MASGANAADFDPDEEPYLLSWIDGVPVPVTDGAIVGRSSDADLTIDHTEVSARHARFEHTETHWQLVDLDSTNGLGLGHGRLDKIQIGAGRTTIWLGADHLAPSIDVEVPSVPGHLGLPPSVPTTTHVLRSIESTIGRSHDCDVSIDDPLMSRRHAIVSTDGTATRIVDLDSANGVVVNGERATETTLYDGDELILGQSFFIYRDGRLEQVNTAGLSIDLDRVSVNIGDFTILDDISVRLPEGSLTAIVGPSGSGKSTLIAAISGDRRPDAGTVRIGGRNLTESNMLSGWIGIVPQDDAVHPYLTIRQALSAAASLRRPSDTDKAEIATQTADLADRLGLAQRLDLPIQKISGGQRKRVSVGYEMTGCAKVVILDEPTAGLDPAMEAELMTALRQLADDGTTVVIVTHRLRSLDFSDSVLALAVGGRLAYHGPPGEVAAHFGCTDAHEIFDILADDVTVQSVRPGEADYQPVNRVPIASLERRRSWLGDLQVLTKRTVQSLLGDWRRTALLVSQAPALGALFAIVVPTDAFELGRPTGSTRQLVLTLTLVMTWIGASNSVREVVEERGSFQREARVGVSPLVFVLSKWLVLALVTAVQALVIFWIATSRQEDPVPEGVLIGNGSVEFVAALTLIGVAGVGAGLAVSAVAKEASKALSILPIVTVSLFLLSGLVVPLNDRGGLDVVGSANPIQWAASSLAVSADLRRADGCAPTLDTTLTSDDPADLPASCINPRWEPEWRTQATNFLMSSLLTLAMLVAAMLIADSTFGHLRQRVQKIMRSNPVRSGQIPR